MESEIIAQHHRAIIDRDPSAHGLKDIFEGATLGRIQTLIIDEKELNQNLNLVCIEVLRHAGDVYVERFKKKRKGVTAIFRY